ncbi:MAG: hypothetical protein ISS25_04020 [Nanoarchaeota archaeon]|nr:hypothetical protein [DPANN group archaeon]MBL7116968.1 hypothetical protein [Nanoarchaeota archaeon]
MNLDIETPKEKESYQKNLGRVVDLTEQTLQKIIPAKGEDTVINEADTQLHSLGNILNLGESYVPDVLNSLIARATQLKQEGNPLYRKIGEFVEQIISVSEDIPEDQTDAYIKGSLAYRVNELLKFD